METTPPTLCTDSSECQNSSCSLVGSNETELLSTQDRELVSILVDLENIDNNSKANVEVTKTKRIEKEGNFSQLLEPTQDRELVSILVDLENIDNNREAIGIGKTKLSEYFCSDAVFNSSWKVSMDNEIKVLEKGLDYAPIQRKIMNPNYKMILKSFVERCALFKVRLLESFTRRMASNAISCGR